ncbi:MAG: hypothetical protein N2449_03620 [Bacteroidales bacterium]|nr:hypothetical protein [Bacteroidales bacterium]
MCVQELHVSLVTIYTNYKVPLLAVRSKIGNNKGYFILDTGAQITVINNQLTNFEYEIIYESKEVAGIDDFFNVPFLKVDEVKIGRYKLILGMCCQVSFSKMSQVINSKYPILGLLGLNFFMQYDAVINLKKNKLILYSYAT